MVVWANRMRQMPEKSAGGDWGTMLKQPKVSVGMFPLETETESWGYEELLAVSRAAERVGFALQAEMEWRRMGVLKPSKASAEEILLKEMQAEPWKLREAQATAESEPEESKKKGENWARKRKPPRRSPEPIAPTEPIRDG